MRRFFRTTTAIAASLSLIAPQIAPAFAQNAPSQEETILQKKKEQLQRQQQKQRQEQRQKQEQRPRAERQEQQRPKPQQAQQQQPRPKPQQAQQQQQQRPRPQQAEQQQRPKPQQAEQRRNAQPAEQPKPRQQAQPEQRRPQPQREAQPEQRARQQPEQRRPQQEQQRQARPQQEQQPQRETRPQQRQPRPEAERPARQAGQQAPRPDRDSRDAARTPERRPAPAVVPPAERKAPPPSADELRRAMENRQRNPDARPNAGQRAGDQRQQEQRQQEQRRDAQRQQEQRQQEQRRDAQRQQEQRQQEQRRDAQRQQEQRRQQNANAQQQRLSPEELRRRIQTGEGRAALPAPEARRGTVNDLARRAAERRDVPPATALTALAAAGNERDRNVRERRITQDGARRSNQDFRTRISDGMRPRDGQFLNEEARRRELDRRARELREDERRVDRRERQLDRREDYWDYYDHDDNDDDDDNSSDIAKLLLAGAAGFMVGKMLSGNRQVALNTGDRAVLMLPDGSQQVVRDDNALLYQPGSDVRTETFPDGSTRTTVLRADGSRVVTIRDADMNILQRTLIRPDGTATRLLDNTYVRPVQVSTLPPPQPIEYSSTPWQEDDLRMALMRESAADRRFTLGQVRDIPEVRSLVAPVNVPDVTFDTGSAALSSNQAEQLATLGKVIRDSIDQNPNEIYMIEGYTDAVGSDAANLALSDRRAESVALALTEYFQVPPENMVVQGYGEQFLLVPSDGDERENRRVAIRRITDLVEQSGS